MLALVFFTTFCARRFRYFLRNYPLLGSGSLNVDTSRCLHNLECLLSPLSVYANTNMKFLHYVDADQFLEMILLMLQQRIKGEV